MYQLFAPFLLLTYSTAHRYFKLCIYFLIYIYLFCFQFWAILDVATIKMCMYFGEHMFSFLLGTCIEAMMLDHRGSICQSLLDFDSFPTW